MAKRNPGQWKVGHVVDRTMGTHHWNVHRVVGTDVEWLLNDARRVKRFRSAATAQAACDAANHSGVPAARGETLCPRDPGFDLGYVHAYLKSALLTVEPEGLTDPQAFYFLEWLKGLDAASGVLRALLQQAMTALYPGARPAERRAAAVAVANYLNRMP